MRLPEKTSKHHQAMKTRTAKRQMFLIIGWLTATLSWYMDGTHAAVTLDGNDDFIIVGERSGDLTISGDLSVMKGIDFGVASSNPALAGVQVTYFNGAENCAKFDLADAAGSFAWRDNMSGTARTKMMLNASNQLLLYKKDNTGAGILIDPSTGQINLYGTSSGIYGNGAAIFTMDASGKLNFGNRSVAISNTSASTSSYTGALTVAGGIGVAADSYINGIRIGRGRGNSAYNTAFGNGALQNNTSGFYNTAYGFYALLFNNCGSGNTASGTYALYGNYNGNYNTAVGNYALLSNSNVWHNTAVGFNTLRYNYSGGSNVAIGSNAGTYQLNGASLSYASNSIYLGANTRGFLNGDQNSIVIGYNGLGEGSNTTVIGNYNTLKTHLYGTVVAKAITINSVPVMTATHGGNNVLSGGALMAIGTQTKATAGNAIAMGLATQATGSSAAALGGVGNQALGLASVAAGYWTKAATMHSVALGALNLGTGTGAQTWVETEPLFELGNGMDASTDFDFPNSSRSNAITTLKNGRTTLTNKEWKAHADAPLADPDGDTDSGGEALVVEGHTRLMGKVVIEQAQGDISMGIYGP